MKEIKREGQHYAVFFDCHKFTADNLHEAEEILEELELEKERRGKQCRTLNLKSLKQSEY